MRTLEEQIGGWCIHFNGTQHVFCRIGVPYEVVCGKDHSKLPCIKENNCAEFCPSACFPTEQEVATRVESVEKEVAAFLARRTKQ